MISSTLESICLFLLSSVSPLLEAVDAEWLQDELSTRRSLSLLSFLFFLLLILLSGLIWPPFLLLIPFIIVIPLFILLVSRLFVFYFSSLSPSTRRLFSALKARQAAAFSLHLDPSRSAESVRQSMLLLMRQMAIDIGKASERLAQSDPSESSRLLLSFCTTEMSSLLYGEVSPKVTSLNSLKTLWELIILLRSECLRLFLLSFPFHPFHSLRTVIPLTFQLRSFCNDLDAIHSRLHSMSFLNVSESSSIPHKVDGSTLVLQLEIIVECLRSGSMSTESAMKTLSQIVSSSHIPSPPPPIPSSSSSTTECTSMEPLIVCDVVSPRDEFFESYGTCQEDGMRREEEGSERDHRSTQVMSELKAAIVERAEEMRERERKVRREQRRLRGEVEDSDEDEEEEEVKEKEEDRWKERRMEGLREEERSGDLKAEIVAVLRQRKGGIEEVIGSGSESESD